MASIVNRRAYRSGINWAVAGFTLHTAPAAGVGQLFIRKLPQTWTMSNAWEKGFRAWQRMIDNATDESGAQSIKGRFLDFKVFANDNHQLLGVAENALPAVLDDTGGWDAYKTGEWDVSTLQIPDATGAVTEFQIIAVGDNTATAKSLIAGYELSRALPYEDDPNVPALANDSWMVDLFSDGTAQDDLVIRGLEVQGDQAPYPFEGGKNIGGGVYTATQYPNGANNVPSLVYHDQANVTTTTIGGKSKLDGGMFPCGLIELQYPASFGQDPATTAYNAVLQIHLVPGSHRGYMCESMTDM